MSNIHTKSASKMRGSLIHIIDDDPDLRKLARRVLENAGCEVEESEGIKAALVKFDKRTPDLIILDINMPEVDGFKLLKFRMMTNRLASVPMIVLSGESVRDRISLAFAMGANDYLVKPFETKTLLQKIKKHLEIVEILPITFTDEKAPKVFGELPVEISSISPEWVTFEGPLRFRSNAPITLRSVFLARLGLKQISGKVPRQGVDIKDGLYRIFSQIVGLSPPQIELIQKVLPKKKAS